LTYEIIAKRVLNPTPVTETTKTEPPTNPDHGHAAESGGEGKGEPQRIALSERCEDFGTLLRRRAYHKCDAQKPNDQPRRPGHLSH
jgi:hypothetical protein